MASKNNKADRIQLLPEHIIDQIKAGEVIERPSTLLKELLENSVDAGADEIDIEIIDNGLELLSVRDNGKGIPFEELDLAFCRHATSKIEKFEDIYNLFTYGFRGEALASIAAVSKLTCVSNPRGEPEGTIKINGGQTVTLDKDEVPEESSGTKMFIRELFYNTPARMKFIQSKTSEKNQLEKIVKAFLLTQPGIKITVKWDEQEKRVFKARPDSELKTRVEETIKKNRPVNLVELGSSYDGVDFKVFLSRESTRGNAGKSQFIFVNNRLVQDVQIHKVILNSAQSLWPIGESGHYCAYIDIPSERVDVNIHPNKIQVKFFEAPKVFSLISGAIKDGLAKQRQVETPSGKAEGSAQSGFLGQGELINEGPGRSREMRQMEYRSFDFEHAGSGAMNTYFQNLDQEGKHANTAPAEQGLVQTLAHHGDLMLAKVSEKIYCVKTPALMSYWLAHCLESGDATATPLLVSQPLKCNGQLDERRAKALGDLGFEIDRIGPQDYVLRTFPGALRGFPFREYLQKYLELEADADFREIILNDQSEWAHHHKKALEKLPLALLISEGLAIEITRDKLGKML